MFKLSSIKNSKLFILTVIFIFIIDANIAILLNIAYLRQVFGFIYLTILPGFLILQLLNLNKISLTERFVLSVGLSISFLMILGIIVNNSSLAFGYNTPLSTTSILTFFDISLLLLSIIAYKISNSTILLPKLDLSKVEIIFLCISITFPILSIFGVYIINETGNNIILIFLLLLIAVYVIFICLYDTKLDEKLFPFFIFIIGISILLLLALRLDHIVGVDAHIEYYVFINTLSNLHWSAFMRSPVDSAISISLLPTIYQSILNMRPEFLYKILHSLIFSISPLVIYIITLKYVNNIYAFLASFFFIAQSGFSSTPMLARTNTAVLFASLAFMVIFNENINEMSKKILFITFLVSCVLSHYSTCYITLFILLFTWIGLELQKIAACNLKGESKFESAIERTGSLCKYHITSSIIALFFVILFFWYNLITYYTFNAGVFFIKDVFMNLHSVFLLDSRGDQAMQAMGYGVLTIPQKIKFIIYYLSIAYIIVGILYSIRKYKEMITTAYVETRKAHFLKSKIDSEFWTISMICFFILVGSFILPSVFKGYDMSRAYFQMTPFFSVFFVIGGIALTNFLKTKRYKTILLIVLIPLLLCTLDVVTIPFSTDGSITLNSNGFYYNYYYISNHDVSGGQWLKNYADFGNGYKSVYTDSAGRLLMSQANIPWSCIDQKSIFIKDLKIKGYIYLRTYNVIYGKLLDSKYKDHELFTLTDKFNYKSLVYNNGGSEIWK